MLAGMCYDDAHELPASARADEFGPPTTPIKVKCSHCGCTYQSSEMVWRRADADEAMTEPENKLEGFWCCPIDGCNGRGFTLDIWPLTKEWVGHDGQKKFFADPVKHKGKTIDDLIKMDEFVGGCFRDDGSVMDPKEMLDD